MTTTVRHQPTRTRAAVAIAGRPGWTPLRAPTVFELAEQVRRYAWTELPARTVTPGADPDRTALARIAARFPTAEQTFGRVALLSLTRRPRSGTCRHCAAALLAATLGEPRPDPTAPPMQALLGDACDRCVARLRTATHVAAVAAAGHLEQRMLDDPRVTRLAARIGYWSRRLGVPAPIVSECVEAFRRPTRGGRWPTGMITGVGGRR
jgi:hypothetical protein